MRRVKVGETVISGGRIYEVAEILDNIEKPQHITGHPISSFGHVHRRTMKFLGQEWKLKAKGGSPMNK